MLQRLRRRYADRLDQIALIAGSYLALPLGTRTYDHAISAMSIHHLLHDAKRDLYVRIRAALKPGGKYIEGDSVTCPEMESQFLAEYHQEGARVPPAEDGTYHIDVLLSIETQRSLLLEAGFRDFELIWQKDGIAGWNFAVYAATA
jgi:tRNA (cmo5U34)-methyltransferase